MSSTPSPTTRISGRGFACLWAARDISALGDWAVFVAVLAWSYRTKESAAILSILLAAQVLPAFLLGPVARLVVNSRNAQVIGIVALLLRAAALAPLLGVTTLDHLQTAITALLAAAIPTAFVRASRQALLPTLIAPERLSGADRGLSATRLLTLVVGPAAGTVLFGMEGLQAATAAAMAALGFSAALLVFARPRVPAPAEGTPSARAALAGVQAGLLHALRYPPLQSVATVRLAAALLMGGLVIPQTAFMVWGLFTGTENVGLVLGGEGLGILVGAVVCRLLERRVAPNTLVAGALGLIVTGLFGIAISTTLNWVVAFAALAGMGTGALLLYLGYLIPRVSAAGLGRSVSTGLESAAEAAALVSAIAMGPLTDSITPRFVMLSSAILLAVLALYAFGVVADRESLAADAPDQDPSHPYPLVRPA